MLVLSRKTGERIVIGDNITIVVNRVAGNRVSIGIDAPNDVKIVRGELAPLVDQFRDSEPSEPGPTILTPTVCDQETPNTVPFQPR